MARKSASSRAAAGAASAPPHQLVSPLSATAAAAGERGEASESMSYMSAVASSVQRSSGSAAPSGGSLTQKASRGASSPAASSSTDGTSAAGSSEGGSSEGGSGSPDAPGVAGRSPSLGEAAATPPSASTARADGLLAVATPGEEETSELSTSITSGGASPSITLPSTTRYSVRRRKSALSSPLLAYHCGRV